jgi:hypothetical protein
MKDKTIRIEFHIENEFGGGMTAEYKVYDIIFTRYDSLFSYDALLDNIKIALKKLGSFTMLTATLSVKNDGDYYSNADIESSFRFVNRYGELKFTRLIGNQYYDFQPSDKKEIFKMVKDLVEKGNKKYIELLKKDNLCLQN